MNNHIDADNLFLYTNNMLDENASVSAKRHLADCSDCSSISDSISATGKLLTKSFESEPLSPGRKAKILRDVFEKIGKNQMRSKKIFYLSMSSAAAVLLCFATYYFLIKESELSKTSKDAVCFGENIMIANHPQTIELLDQSMIYASPGTSFKINSDITSPRGYCIDLKFGELTCDISHGKGIVFVNTPAGRIKVLGTAFTVKIFDDGGENMKTGIIGGAVIAAVVVTVGTIELLSDSGSAEATKNQAGVMKKGRSPIVANNTEIEKIGFEINNENFQDLFDSVSKLKTEIEALKSENIRLLHEIKDNRLEDQDLKRWDQHKLMDDDLLKKIAMSKDQEQNFRLATAKFLNKRFDAIKMTDKTPNEKDELINGLKQQLENQYMSTLSSDQYSILKAHRDNKALEQKYAAANLEATRLMRMLSLSKNQSEQVILILKSYCDSFPDQFENWYKSEEVINRINSLLVDQHQITRFKIFLISKRPMPTTGFAIGFYGKDKYGAVAHVEKGSSAESAGIKKGDIITEIGGEAIGKVEDYRSILVKFKPGDSITIKFTRDGKDFSVQIILGDPSRIQRG